MDIIETDIPGVRILKPRRFGDHRGYFCETYNAKRMSDAGISITFIQDNESLSAERGTLRGLHFQAPPMAQTKLVRVSRGRVLDVAVDIRVGSPTYKHWVSAELSDENGHQLFVPAGFLHGFLTLEANTLVNYKVDNFYSAECDGSVRFDDPDLGIDWGIPGEDAVLSDKDRKAPSFAEFSSPFVYEGHAE